MKDKYSGKEVIRAGESFLVDDIFEDEELLHHSMTVLSYWRFQHEVPLEHALTLLSDEVRKKDKNAIFAKRLKRYASIVAKLRRFPTMKLKNMQDIGGCRAIVSSQKKLYQVVRELRRMQEFKNNKGRIRFKDYIEKPKADGYRGYHLIGTFKDSKGENKLIELQLRTKLQHDWATALEIVDLFTGQALKSNQGREEWAEFFKLVSSHFSLMESVHLFSAKKPEEQLEGYRSKLREKPHYGQSGRGIQLSEAKLRVVRSLEAFAHSLKTADEHIAENQVLGYVLLRVDTVKANVESRLFSNDKTKEAEKKYLEFEKETAENSDLVVALVSTTAVGGIKEAYPNYFADSSEFLKYLTYILDTQMVEKKSIIGNLFR